MKQMSELELMNKKAFDRSGYRNVIYEKANALNIFNKPGLTNMQSLMSTPFKEVLRQISISNGGASI